MTQKYTGIGIVRRQCRSFNGENMNTFNDKIRAAVADYSMLSAGDEVVAALSGGADSVSLLHALWELREELGITLSACHVNHGLRGEEADNDMRFCQELCARLGIELHLLCTDVRAAQQKHESVEEAARRIRYDFFAEVSAGKKLATAHNLNDSVETVLLNMMRGTGLKGLCGIPPVRGNIIRPLIYCTREDVERCCSEKGLAYVTDKTNLCDDYTRNKVRHCVLPEMVKISGAFLETSARTQKSLREDSELLESMAEQALEAAKTDDGYLAKELTKLPKPLLNRAVKRMLMDGGIEPSTLRISMAEEIIAAGRGRINPCRGKFVTVKKGVAFVEEMEQIYKKHLPKE